jgi:hypothetical protein
LAPEKLRLRRSLVNRNAYLAAAPRCKELLTPPELADLFREAASLSGNTATNGAEFVRRWTEFLSSLPEDH